MNYPRLVILVLFALGLVPLGSGQHGITGRSMAPAPVYGLGDPTPGPLKIGLLFPYTGALSTFGPEFENAANLAVQHINDAGGVNGQPIQTIVGDTGTDPEIGASDAGRLVSVEGVSAIVGAVASSVTLSVAESVTIPSQVVLISPSSTSPALTTVDDDDYLFRTAPSDAMQARVLAELAMDEGFQTACIMYVNNAYGQGLSDEFTQSFEALGGQVVAAVPHDSEAVSYLAELTTCVQDNPDVLAALSYSTGQGTVYVKEALEAGLIDNFLFADGLKSQHMIDKVGPALDGMLGTAHATVTSELFDSEYESVYGAPPPPLPFIGEAYSAVALLALAAEKDGSTNSTGIRDALRQVANAPGVAADAGSAGLAQALQTIRDGAEVNYSGHTGVLDLDFDVNGDVTSAAIEVWTIQDSQIVTVGVEYVGPKPTPTPTATPTPKPTATPKNPSGDTDGDTILNGTDPDDDNDDCTDVEELGDDPFLGGLRDPHNFWDFFDVPTGAGLSRDGSIASEDIFGVIGRFNATDVGPGDFYRDDDPLSTPNQVDISGTVAAHRQNYHPAYDRGAFIGPNSWNLGAADGAVASGDIFGVLGQFGHSCSPG